MPIGYRPIFSHINVFLKPYKSVALEHWKDQVSWKIIKDSLKDIKSLSFLLSQPFLFFAVDGLTMLKEYYNKKYHIHKEPCADTGVIIGY